MVWSFALLDADGDGCAPIQRSGIISDNRTAVLLPSDCTAGLSDAVVLQLYDVVTTSGSAPCESSVFAAGSRGARRDGGRLQVHIAGGAGWGGGGGPG